MTTATQNAEGSLTLSAGLDEMTLDQLVELQQHLGRQVDALREKRVYLNAKIAERLKKGERNAPPEANGTPES